MSRLTILFCSVALLAGVGVPLWDQDEAAYAGFALRMWATGQGWMPDFTWSDVHRKPPLLSWLITGCFALFGPHTWAARLPGMASFVGTCLALGHMGAPVFGATRARTAAGLLASSLALFSGKIALTDGPLLLCTTVAMLALLGRVHGSAPGLTTLVVFWVAVGGALLAKGPPIVLVLAAASAVLLAHPNRGQLLAPWLGLPLAFAPLLVWGWGAWRVDPTGIRWMIDWYILRRGSVLLGQGGPPGTFALTLLVLLFPWSGALPGALWRLWTTRRAPGSILLAAWLAGGWLIWELFPTKLPMYAAGAWPAAALLLAPSEGFDQGKLDRITIALAVAIGAVFLGLGWLTPLAAVPSLALVLLPRARPLVAPAMIVLFWTVALPALRPRLMVTADVAVAALEAGAPVAFAADFHLPSLPFYVEAAGIPHRTLRKGEVARADEVLVEMKPGPGPGISGWIPDKGTQVHFVVTPPGTR